jgi:selenium-dependent xanthine dehydrogenase
MIHFIVNGMLVSGDANMTLLRFLRDKLHYTSVKDGCSEGACGTCMVILEGQATKACLHKLSQLEGKTILTVEGLSAREKDVYSECFAEAGAVQCGFCIPGMVISAKALLDTNQNPTRAEIKEAIKNNICRCTGYAKIEEAIMNAAKYFREDLPLPAPPEKIELGGRFKRVDAVDKVLGQGQFVDDLTFDGMIYASAVRSEYPRAVVTKIDTSKAELHPDCVKILTAKDVPYNKVGHIVPDWDVMIKEGQETRFIGDAIALVASKNRNTLEEIKQLVEVTYTELEPVTTPADALRADAPFIHETGNIASKEYLRRGDVAKAFREAAHIVSHKYFTPFNDHAFLEPECAIAMPMEGGGLHLFTGSQSVYDEQRETAAMLKISADQVHVTSMLVGGGFGGKEDMSVQHHAALMAWHTGKPVKVKFSRQESLVCHTKRHAMEIELVTACDKDGKLLGMKAVLLADTGAYASLAGPVLQRACTHAAGPYNYQNIDILGMSVYTNNVVAGAYRGFGVTQSCFAFENNLNLLAEKVGISPWEIRYKNAARPGDVLPNGQIVDPNCGIAETLLAVKEIYENHPRAGIACAMKNSGKGVAVKDVGRCILSVEQGKVHIRTSAACMGQGIATMCVHMACETTGLSPSVMVHEFPDTIRTPDSGTSTASRQTLVTGEAVRRVSQKLADALQGKTLADLEGQEFYDEFLAETDPLGSTKANPVSHVGYSYATQVVLLDETGKVEKVVAAYDVGQPVNRQAVEGQIEGGVIMGLGFALTEDFPVVDGRVKKKFGSLGLMRATQAPPVEVILVDTGREKNPYAYGAKGVGELCLIPTSPAVAHAYYRFDGEFRSRLPLQHTFYKKRK